MQKINFYAQNMYFCTLCVSSAVSCYTIGVSLLRPNNWTRCYATALLVYFLLVYIIGCDAWSLHCGCCSILDSTIWNTYWTVSPFAVALLGLTTDLNPLSGRPIPPPDRQPARSSFSSFFPAAYFGSFHSLSYHHQNAKTRPRKTAARALPHFCQLTKLLYRSPLHLLTVEVVLQTLCLSWF